MANFPENLEEFDCVLAGLADIDSTLKSEERWTQSAFARRIHPTGDEQKMDVLEILDVPKAEIGCWCLIGAVQESKRGKKISPRYHVLITTYLYNAMTSQQRNTYRSIVDLNDAKHMTFVKIKRLIARAIKNAKNDRRRLKQLLHSNRYSV